MLSVKIVLNYVYQWDMGNPEQDNCMTEHTSFGAILDGFGQAIMTDNNL